MIVKKCDICGAEMRMTTPRYKVTFDGWLYKKEHDVCIECFNRITEEIKQADTPQTETQNSNENSNVISVYDEVSEAVRCAMCSNPNKSDRGCDGACSYDEKLYERIMKAIAESVADTPQTTLCRECDDYAGDGMYCASNYLVSDFSTSRENCEADTPQTNIDKAKADIAEWSSWSKTYEAMCEEKMKGAEDLE